MSNPTYKANAMMDQLADKLKLRLSTRTFTRSLDTDNCPLLFIDDGSPATTENAILIKIAAISAPLAKDILGNTAFQYTPHVLQLVTEAPASGSGAGVYVPLTTLAPVLEEAMALRTRFEWYQATNGGAPAASDIAASKLKVAVEPSPYYPAIANQ